MPHYHGSCHCAKIQFDVELDLSSLLTCNCSMCARSGAIMVFVKKDKLSNVVGMDKSVDYQFGKKRIHHRFCPTCGIRPLSYGPGAEEVIVNVRCLNGIDVHTLSITRQFDGKAM